MKTEINPQRQQEKKRQVNYRNTQKHAESEQKKVKRTKIHADTDTNTQI